MGMGGKDKAGWHWVPRTPPRRAACRRERDGEEGMREPSALVCDCLVRKQISWPFWTFSVIIAKTQGGEEAGLRKTGIHASSSHRGLYWIPRSAARRGIHWDSPDLLCQMIKYETGNDERAVSEQWLFFWATACTQEWPTRSGLCRDLQERAQLFWPQRPLARVHVSVTMHFILYTRKLKLVVTWIVCFPLCFTNLDKKCVH